MNDNILTAKQAKMLTEKRDRTILLLSEAIADAAISGKYNIQLYADSYKRPKTELEELYFDNHTYFKTYILGLGYSVVWMYMQYDEINWEIKDLKPDNV